MTAFKKPLKPFLVPLDEGELTSYHRMRIPEPAPQAAAVNA